ncbi:MAG: rRNA maturation RNase YbeY [Chloroflexi bacterium RBG_16_48_8]|nr:MAG: rRNA maturation RNase YbeY [Chloroflexi bacterium RBG_16_48_8]
MSYEIFIHADPRYHHKIHDLEMIADTALHYLHAQPGDLTLVLADNETIQQLNNEFAGVNQPTDVLSFPNGDTDVETDRTYYGDIVLSIPFAEEQAREAGHSLKDELTLLILHGILHLLGFEHSDNRERQEMWSLQDEILAHLGSKITSPR